MVNKSYGMLLSVTFRFASCGLVPQLVGSKVAYGYFFECAEHDNDSPGTI